MTVAVGDTFHIPSGPTGSHLHVVALGPVVIPGYGSAPMIILVGMTTTRAGAHHDAACELSVGDHPFVQHPTFMAYRWARVERESDVIAWAANGTWRSGDKCSQDLVARIEQGARASDFLRADLQALF